MTLAFYIILALVIIALWNLLDRLCPDNAFHFIVSELIIKIIGYGLLLGPLVYYLFGF